VKLGVEGEGAAEAELEVRVPRRARVWVKGAAGAIEVSGIDGQLDLYSVAGDVRVRGRPAQLTAETIDGDLDVADGAGSARLKTAAGAVTVAGRVRGLTVGSVSGPVRVALEQVQRGEISTVTGSVHFRGALAADGLLDVVTHEASVTLVLPAATEADFELRTFDGLLVNRFGREAGRFSRGKPFRFSTRRTGAADDPDAPGARVAVRTLKGDISLFRQ
jgi:DUF4097 and DUF4098 domain-containing protein YvlB